MICNFSELKDKEIVNTKTGLKIGYADDIELNTDTGEVLSLIVYGRPRVFGIMGKDEDILIKCKDIDLIGDDTILVSMNDNAICTKKKEYSAENLLS